MLYDRNLYRKEVFFDELTTGQTFSPLRYRFETEDVETYLRAVGDTAAAFRDNRAAREAGFDGALVPPLATLNYGFIYQAMGRRPPTGFLNTATSFEFHAPAVHGEELTLAVSVEDKFVKRDRKYVILRAVVTNDRGQLVSSARVECIFPA